MVTVDDDDGAVVDIRGDPEDVLSQGFICPKGVAVKSLHTDPDRLRTPMVRWGGMLREATWTEAYTEIANRLPALRDRHGPDCIALFSGVSADVSSHRPRRSVSSAKTSRRRLTVHSS